MCSKERLRLLFEAMVIDITGLRPSAYYTAKANARLTKLAEPASNFRQHNRVHLSSAQLSCFANSCGRHGTDQRLSAVIDLSLKSYRKVMAVRIMSELEEHVHA